MTELWKQIAVTVEGHVQEQIWEHVVVYTSVQVLGRVELPVWEQAAAFRAHVQDQLRADVRMNADG